MAGSQRPGLIGVEEPMQLLNYQTDFNTCRRLETLVCWDDTTPADIVYAARAAGVIAPLSVQSSAPRPRVRLRCCSVLAVRVMGSASSL